MSESALLAKSWDLLRSRVNAQLTHYMRLDADCPASLREAMSYSLLAGGKRLRPVLTLMACEACGGPLEAALPAACAIEMVHTYSLIHDDLPAMDDDDLRRGRPTCHVQFGEALAILAGDALLTLAFEIMARDVSPPAVAAACCGDLASAAGAIGMVAGQVADLEAEESQGPGAREPGARRATDDSRLSTLDSIHRRKTGRLLTSAVTLGARIGGADADLLDGLRSYGNCVGLAFQIADDLLDVSGDAARMGKNVRKDADHGKLTYPSLLGQDASRRRAEELIGEARRAIAPLGERGRRLEALAHFVLERDH
jgi:geranylgeranyl diphosphate synthase type II